MKIKDIKPGIKVYHTIYTHYGPGEVVGSYTPSILEHLFVKNNKKKFRVKFTAIEKMQVCYASDLRLTPNLKQMKQLQEIYKKRNTETYIINNDQLVIEKK